MSIKINRRRAAIVAVGLIIVGFLGYKYFSKKPQQAQYQTAVAEKGTLVTSITASGSISSGSTVTVGTQAGGIVSKVYVKNGDKVTQGQKIADITLDQDSQQRAASAWSSYLSAKNSLVIANQNKLTLQGSVLGNQSDLLTAQGNATGTDNWDPTSPAKQKLDNARRVAELTLEGDQMKLSTADTTIAKANSDLTSAWLSYQSVSGSITAPISGIVGNLTIAEGAPITASTSSSNSSVTSQKVATITIPQGGTQTIVNLSEIDAGKVSAGLKATITLDAFPTKSFTGKVILVNTNGQVSSGVTTYPATIAFDTSDPKIYPNMSATAKIIINVKNDVILVPSSAVQTTGGQTTVRVLVNGQMQTVNVEVGDANDTQTEIISGVSEGDTVVTSVSASTGSTGASGSIFGAFGGNRGFGGGGGGGNVRIPGR